MNLRGNLDLLFLITAQFYLGGVLTVLPLLQGNLRHVGFLAGNPHLLYISRPVRIRKG